MDSRRREIERGESIEKKEGKQDKQKEEESRHCEGEVASERIQRVLRLGGELTLLMLRIADRRKSSWASKKNRRKVLQVSLLEVLTQHFLMRAELGKSASNMEVRARVRRRRRRRERRMPELSKKSEDSYSTVREDTHPEIRTWSCRA